MKVVLKVAAHLNPCLVVEENFGNFLITYSKPGINIFKENLNKVIFEMEFIHHKCSHLNFYTFIEKYKG